MVCTDRFVGKHNMKDWWEEGCYVIVNQLEDWPVYVLLLRTNTKPNT